ncbi:hypothetical protein AVEN_9380-1 [Araneus ventricosus]|uniref:Uncharacterized protein n=1 Tax=Araneus ventricosus TaxID=182803 RepID=A0A4Y2DJ48_ARAVE|nr:hypothetical protein AVEN_9380-1 [Araneus ventricosus]
MASVLTDIVSRSSSVDVREIDKQAKNPWRWEWLEKQAEGRYLREIIRKLNKCGACYCIVCRKELAYESRRFVEFTDHVKSSKHKSFLQTRKEHFALPVAPDLLELVKEMSKDRKALNRITMHRNAASYKTRFGIFKTVKEALFEDLQKEFFSLRT